MSDLARRAFHLDESDPLRPHPERFHIPTGPDGRDVAYLCGNSLGLQPRGVRDAVLRELDDWARLGVEGHFHAQRPWFDYHARFPALLAPVVGALPHEVVVMNALTTNLHLLLVSFYRPTSTRYRIVLERNAFPSDRYAVASQAAFHGFDPADAVVELGPRPGEDALRVEDVEAWFREHGHTVACTLWGGVSYYTGQAMDIAALTRIARQHGAIAGFDLAHAAGNLALELHAWDVDFAAWCSYKYLNAGPGAVAGAFVHERHAERPDLPRFAGWWGNDPATRFDMPERFAPARGADGWQLSNAPILPMAALEASLELFDLAGMPALRNKALQLGDLLFDALDERLGDRIVAITPRDPERRGCQVSFRIGADARVVQQALLQRGVVCDFRRPDVIRAAPVPLYNSFNDVIRFVDTLTELLDRS